MVPAGWRPRCAGRSRSPRRLPLSSARRAPRALRPRGRWGEVTQVESKIAERAAGGGGRRPLEGGPLGGVTDGQAKNCPSGPTSRGMSTARHVLALLAPILLRCLLPLLLPDGSPDELLEAVALHLEHAWHLWRWLWPLWAQLPPALPRKMSRR